MGAQWLNGSVLDSRQRKPVCFLSSLNQYSMAMRDLVALLIIICFQILYLILKSHLNAHTGVFKGGFPLNISPLPTVQNSYKVIHSQYLFTHTILTKVFYLKDLP